ncbi:MAG: flagellar biosynthesis protein FlhB [Angelakisella sp.]|nr:flagellar biosynthesis protein FlhB [Angelakisella sp.]
MAGEKTEKATPKRKQDERKKGNIFQSREIGIVFPLIFVFYSFKFLAPYSLSAIQKNISYFFNLAATTDIVTPVDIKTHFITGCITFLITAMPLLLISSLVAVVFTMAQTKMLFSFKALKFKASRLSPIQGFKKIFSLRGIIELLKSIIKIIILGTIIWNVLSSEIPYLPRMMDMEVGTAIFVTGNIILSIVKFAAIIFSFVALFDYIYQWWDYERNLRMSKQEIKEEYKQTEGDPQIKSKIKEKQQEQARRRMMANVPSADVVIRNPTHYAVAIKYDPEKNNAPMVIAKGADNIALKIIEIAEQNDIIVTENRPLARGLYETVDIDMEIPDQFYQAVAEVLAFVYSLKKKELK